MRYLAVISSALILTLAFCSPGTAVEQLDALIQEALENNPRILVAESAWRAAQAKITTARAWPDPRVGVRFERNPGAVYSLGEAQMRMVSISQMIPFPGKLSLRREMFTSDAHKARWEHEAIRQEVIAGVKSAYYDLFVMNKSLQLLQEQVDLLAAFERTAQVKYSVGQASQHDVLKAQVELALLSDELQTLDQEDVVTAKARLNILLDRPVQNPVELPGDISIPRLNMTREELEQLALENRPSLAAGQEMIGKTKAAHSLAKKGYLPDLTVILMQQWMETAMGDETSRGLRLSLNLPLWFWGKKAHVSEKRALWRSAQASYQHLRSQIQLQVQQALAEYRAAQSRAELFETTVVPLAEQSLKAARAAYENREIDFLSLISAERNLRQAKLKHFKALGKLGKSLASLEQAVGVTF
jgi:outer membrane protein TolC